MITIYSRKEIDAIRRSCRVVGEALNYMGELIRPGITTKELDDELEWFIRDKGGRPAFKGIKGDAPIPFPASGCFSIDEVVVHGIPSKRKLKDGEIIGVDVGVEIDGFYGDAARTFLVGDVSFEKRHLVETTEESFWKGVELAEPGNMLSDISHRIQKFAEGRGFSVVRALVGHGVGRNLHEEPQVPNYGLPGNGPKLRSGMVLAIEPMINTGVYDVNVLQDGWTIITADNKPSAHYENTIVIFQEGPDILTLVEPD
ncbi:MAG: type I methionyl aminopeptidase [candidate division Zixibacteria bacterium]|nr:type I methionyl aminopeptidase [Candidatus Tariuqbacter arcticus]